MRPRKPPSPLGVVIRARLKAIGKKTQAWLAEQVGVSPNAVSKWVRFGEISVPNARKAAAALDIDVGELLSHATDIEYSLDLRTPLPAGEPEPGPYLAEDLQPLLDIAAQLTDANRRRLFRHAIDLLREQPPAEKRAS